METMELIGIIVLIVGFVLIAVELVVPGFGPDRASGASSAWYQVYF